MWIAILAGVVCLVIAIVLFTPVFRHALLFRPVALFFIFEGIWIMGNYLAKAVVFEFTIPIAASSAIIAEITSAVVSPRRWG